MYSKARLHFKKTDPKLHEASLEFEIDDIVEAGDLFVDICRAIIGQQLSGKAADTIFGRFELLFPDKSITPEKVLKLEDTDLRACGLSGAKSRAVKNLSEKVISKEVDLASLSHKKDEEVLVELMKVKGIGPWTAEMILMFSLGRTDVFSLGDLGLQKGLMHLYGWKKLPPEKKIQTTIGKWSPYRTYAARVLWKLADKKKIGIARKRAFTLIELLVVISIVAFLASIVLASLNSARDRAAVAAGKQFSDHSRVALAAKSANNAPLVFLDFDGATSSGPGFGVSGLTNSGLLTGNVSTWNAFIEPDGSLYGFGRHLKGPVATLSYPFSWVESAGSSLSQGISSLNFTVAIWFRTNGSSYATYCSGECRIISNTPDGNNTSLHLTAGGVIGMYIEGTSYISATLSPKDSWYHLAFTSANKGATTDLALYINGKQVAKNTITTPTFGAPPGSIAIGGACCTNYVLPSALYDDAAFYDSTLLSSDIEKLFAQEKPKFLTKN